MRTLRFICAAVLLFVAGEMTLAQTGAFPGFSAAKEPVPGVPGNAQFYATAQSVLHVMSKILDLPVRSPLKESIRTKAQIRAYLVEEQKRDESAKQRYADKRTLEAFGLIPQGFPLDSFMLNLLTDQVAGLYDPRGKQFFIASWISPVEQKPVMAHELTHALDDQYFHLQKWQNAVRSNDDASLARDAVIEGSALDAMMDYSLRGLHTSVRELPDVAPFIETGVAGQMEKDPILAKAPAFIRDELLFPYLQGAVFSQAVLKKTSGWSDFKDVFRRPPVSTQQILHPGLYFEDVRPETVKLPNLKSVLPRGYSRLDENVVGEFALSEILKKFLGPGDAHVYAPMWRGDRYAVYENKASKQTVLVVLLALKSEDDAKLFFPAYRKALDQKDHPGEAIAEGPEYARFKNVFLNCERNECLSIEGAEARTVERIEEKLHWRGGAGMSGRLRKKAGTGNLK